MMKNIIAATKVLPMKLINFVNGILYTTQPPVNSSNLGIRLQDIAEKVNIPTEQTIVEPIKTKDDSVKSNREILRTGVIGVHYSYSYKNERRRIVGFRVTHNGKVNKSFSFQKYTIEKAWEKAVRLRFEIEDRADDPMPPITLRMHRTILKNT
jgi:hypothetical protein